METWNKKVCIVGAGNAAHALSAMWPPMGLEVYMWASFQDEAERMNEGLERGPITATFAEGNPLKGDIQGKPVKVSKDPADVVPQCDLLFLPLPSFAYFDVFKGLKPILREGQYVCVTPGQGGLDWIAYEILGPEVYNKVTFLTVQPMPFNCRISEWGRSVQVQVLKRRYDICCQPASKMDDCLKLNTDLFPESENSPLGPILAATLVPLNAVIHPARVYTLLTEHHSWEPGKFLAENPLFYESMTVKDTTNQLKVNSELDNIVLIANLNGIKLNVPDCYNFLAKTYNGVSGDYPPREQTSPEDLVHLWAGPMYKTFKCPLKLEEGGWVPDFENRYFTEDIPCGLCTYKGVAQLFGLKTPMIDSIIIWAQGYMGKEYIVNGRLNEETVPETFTPQRFGIRTVAHLKKVMGIDLVEAA